MSVSQKYFYDTLKIINKKIYIIGLGTTGISAFRFFSKYDLSIACWDDNSEVRAKFYNQHQLQNIIDFDFTKVDFIIISPGISLFYPEDHYIVKQCKLNNIPIYTDIEIFMLLFPSKHYIGVTGTNGKSTVVSLLQHVFIENNMKSILCGNIGTSPLDFENSTFEIVIFELSSYQLEIMSYNDNVKFNISILLNFTSDHISYHGSLDKYFAAKSFIIKNQTKNNTLIVNKEVFTKLQKINSKLQQKIILISKCEKHYDKFAKEVYYTDKDIIYFGKYVLDYTKLKYLKGEHNAQNICFVITCAKLYGLSTQNIIKSIENFKGLPHRQEFFLSFRGINFINDSKSTTIDSSIQALKTFDDNIFLILGGQRKTDDIDDLLPYLKQTHLVLLIGSSVDIFSSILKNNNITNFVKCDTMSVAINIAYDCIINSDLEKATILLSPGCASFDQYKNFIERGNNFKMLVKNLVENVN